MKRNQKGFTLMEMLIVVAIIAVLVAIAIPTFTAQLHKARVAADWANVRAYYAQIQADYMLTGEKNPKVKIWGLNQNDTQNFTFLDGTTVNLDGHYAVSFVEREGYSVAYHCSKFHPACDKTFGE